MRKRPRKIRALRERKAAQSVQFVTNEERSQRRGDTAERVSKTYARDSRPTGSKRKSRSRTYTGSWAYRPENARSGPVTHHVGISLVRYLLDMDKHIEAKTVLEEILDGKRAAQ